MVSGFFGMLGVFCLIFPAIMLGGSGGFFSLPALAICVFLPFCLALSSAGAKDFWRAFRSPRALFFSPKSEDFTARNVQVLKHMISYTYAAGVIGAFIGWIQMFAQFQAFSSSAAWFASSLLPFFYSVVIAECFFRPAARRIEGEMEKSARHSDRQFDSALNAVLERAHAGRSCCGSPEE